jgi:hypothetical protein
VAIASSKQVVMVVQLFFCGCPSPSLDWRGSFRTRSYLSMYSGEGQGELNKYVVNTKIVS